MSLFGRSNNIYSFFFLMHKPGIKPPNPMSASPVSTFTKMSKNDYDIDISGLPKVILLMRLVGHLNIHSFNIQRAKQMLKNGYIDYFGGRAIKTNLSGNIVNTQLYDRDAGKDAFKSVVEQLRKDLAINKNITSNIKH